MAPYSPRLMTSVCGPMSRILAAARRRLCSPESRRASLSLISRKSHSLEGLEQLGAEIVDPVIHGVAAGELDAVHLGAHAALQAGLDVAEQQVGLGAVGFGQLGVEIGEDVEIGAQGGAVVHVGRVDARPEEGLAAGTRSRPARSMLREASRSTSSCAKSSPTTADDLDRREIAGGERDIGGRAAQHAVHFSMRRFHAVIRDGTNDDQ